MNWRFQQGLDLVAGKHMTLHAWSRPGRKKQTLLCPVLIRFRKPVREGPEFWRTFSWRSRSRRTIVLISSLNPTAVHIFADEDARGGPCLTGIILTWSRSEEGMIQVNSRDQFYSHKAAYRHILSPCRPEWPMPSHRVPFLLSGQPYGWMSWCQ